VSRSLDGTSALLLDWSGISAPEPGDVLHQVNTRGTPVFLVVAVREVHRRQPVPGERRFVARALRNPPAEDIDPDARHVDIHVCRRPCTLCGAGQ
jgi:hypothetical protein